jgi:hypothetical protein
MVRLNTMSVIYLEHRKASIRPRSCPGSFPPSLTAWRLKALQQAADDQNMARVCRRFGISRKSFYKWKRRHVEHGDAYILTY